MENEYKTKDLAEASALLTKKRQLLRIDRQGKTCWFIFDDYLSCKQIVHVFWFGDCLVNARGYYDSVLALKNRIFAL